MIIKQLSIFVENRLGRLAEITKTLGDAGVDIRALSLADTTDFGILRLIVNRPEEAILALKEAHLAVSLTDVIAVGIPDEPGSFGKLVQLLGEKGINIDYMYAFVSRTDQLAYVIVRVEEPAKAVALLQNSFRLLTSSEIYNM